MGTALLCLFLLLGGKDPWFAIELRVYPLVSQAPATVLVKIRIEPRPENRKYTVIVDGENYYSESWGDLDGDRAPAIQRERAYPALPSGDYNVKVTLYKLVEGKVKTDTESRHFLVT